MPFSVSLHWLPRRCPWTWLFTGVLIKLLMRSLAGKIHSLVFQLSQSWCDMADMAPLWLLLAPQVLDILVMSSLIPWLRMATYAGDTQNIYQPVGYEHQPITADAAVSIAGLWGSQGNKKNQGSWGWRAQGLSEWLFTICWEHVSTVGHTAP